MYLKYLLFLCFIIFSRSCFFLKVMDDCCFLFYSFFLFILMLCNLEIILGERRVFLLIYCVE